MLAPMMTSNRPEQLWDSVLIRVGGCWNWQGPTRGNYGVMRLKGMRVSTHRLAFQLAHGPIPDGLCVLHHCDNPRCVNPNHIYAGTYKQNSQDAINRGRIARQSGATNPSSKISAGDVDEIKSLAGRGVQQKLIAARFNLSRAQISRIVNGRRWQRGN